MAALHRPALPAPRTFEGRLSRRSTLAAVAIIIVAAAALQVNQFSHAASTGYTLDALSQQRTAKQAANHELEAEVAQLSSLSRVELDARTRIGLVPAKKKVYVTVNQPVPNGQSLPTRFVQQAAAAAALSPEPAPAPPIWKRLMHLLPFF